MHLKKNQKLFPMESLFGIEFQFLEKVSFFSWYMSYRIFRPYGRDFDSNQVRVSLPGPRLARTFF